MPCAQHMTWYIHALYILNYILNIITNFLLKFLLAFNALVYPQFRLIAILIMAMSSNKFIRPITLTRALKQTTHIEKYIS